jgi:carbonic anhydrase/acetyltransferase-like protein (isoleucine patch superfamily)
MEVWGPHRPVVPASAFVHPAAVLIGEVRLGERVSVWPFAVLRGDMGPIEVGDDSNVQDGAICHDHPELASVRIGRRVTVGHRALLHGCRIGDDCLVGMGAILLDGVEIGDGCLVAAGALVPPGRVVPPGSRVMGSPARVVGPVTPADREAIERGWRSYGELVRQRREAGARSVAS